MKFSLVKFNYTSLENFELKRWQSPCQKANRNRAFYNKRLEIKKLDQILTGMIILYELIDLLPKSFVPLFSKQQNDLFLFLQKNRMLTEAEAAKLFLKSDRRKKQFNKLKHKLKSLLINHIIVNPPIWADAEYKKLHDTCFKNFTTYKIFLISGNSHTGVKLARQLLPMARSLEFYTLVFEIASDLQFHYSSLEISPGLSKKYGKIANNSVDIIRAETIVRKHHSQISVICNTRDSFNASIINEFKVAANEVESLLKLGSNKLGRLIYNIIIARYYVEYEYDKIIFYCDQALQYFSKDHPNIIAFRFSFLQKKLPALVALSRPEEAKELAKEACHMMPIGKFNWHLVFIQRLTVCLHSGDYQEAYDLYKAHTKYGCKYQMLTEYWLIMKGYLYFLIQAEKIEPYNNERFNLGKFLNEVPLYARDKTGNNINILILQILIQMQRGQFGKIIDQIESLGAYARKYTRNPETIRANIFINMIIKMEAASFHRAATERKTQKLFEKLKNTPLKLGQNLAVEIIPYEVLWEMILYMLDNKFRATTQKKINIKK